MGGGVKEGGGRSRFNYSIEIGQNNYRSDTIGNNENSVQDVMEGGYEKVIVQSKDTTEDNDIVAYDSSNIGNESSFRFRENGSDVRNCVQRYEDDNNVFGRRSDEEEELSGGISIRRESVSSRERSIIPEGIRGVGSNRSDYRYKGERSGIIDATGLYREGENVRDDTRFGCENKEYICTWNDSRNDNDAFVNHRRLESNDRVHDFTDRSDTSKSIVSASSYSQYRIPVLPDFDSIFGQPTTTTTTAATATRTCISSSTSDNDTSTCIGVDGYNRTTIERGQFENETNASGLQSNVKVCTTKRVSGHNGESTATTGNVVPGTTGSSKSRISGNDNICNGNNSNSDTAGSSSTDKGNGFDDKSIGNVSPQRLVSVSEIEETDSSNPITNVSQNEFGTGLVERKDGSKLYVFGDKKSGFLNEFLSKDKEIMDFKKKLEKCEMKQVDCECNAVYKKFDYDRGFYRYTKCKNITKKGQESLLCGVHKNSKKNLNVFNYKV